MSSLTKGMVKLALSGRERADRAINSVQKAVALLRWEAAHPRQDSAIEARRWLNHFAAQRLMEALIEGAQDLVGLLNASDEFGEIEDLEKKAQRLHKLLKAERLATKLDLSEGRTPEETRLFQEGAQRLRGDIE